MPGKLMKSTLGKTLVGAAGAAAAAKGVDLAVEGIAHGYRYLRNRFGGGTAGAESAPATSDAQSAPAPAPEVGGRKVSIKADADALEEGTTAVVRGGLNALLPGLSDALEAVSATQAKGKKKGRECQCGGTCGKCGTAGTAGAETGAAVGDAVLSNALQMKQTIERERLEKKLAAAETKLSKQYEEALKKGDKKIAELQKQLETAKRLRLSVPRMTDQQVKKAQDPSVLEQLFAKLLDRQLQQPAAPAAPAAPAFPWMGFPPYGFPPYGFPPAAPQAAPAAPAPAPAAAPAAPASLSDLFGPSQVPMPEADLSALSALSISDIADQAAFEATAGVNDDEEDDDAMAGLFDDETDDEDANEDDEDDEAAGGDEDDEDDDDEAAGGDEDDEDDDGIAGLFDDEDDTAGRRGGSYRPPHRSSIWFTDGGDEQDDDGIAGLFDDEDDEAAGGDEDEDEDDDGIAGLFNVDDDGTSGCGCPV